MMRPALLALTALALNATGCGSQSRQQPQEPAPANQAGPEESGGGEAPAVGEQGPAGVSETPLPGQSAVGGDRDGDGVGDDMDKCPDEPEDRDGFGDGDGCPDPDNDQDGILDIDDKCPADPEAKNGRQDEDGCPD